ncbi:MAG: phosphatase PAP2 family protein [Coriobacteriales bacterium]|nr:phosphatase PAP2 family protein [Coriobacteriales bacterium]
MSRRPATLGLSRDLRFGIVALALPAIVLFGMLVFAITLSPQFRAFDRVVSEALRAQSTQTGLVWIAEVATWFGSTIGIIVVATIAVIGLLAVKRWRGAIYVLATLVPGWLFGLLVKELVDRTRPAGALIPLPHDASFPSGHALASVLLYGSLAVLAATWVRPRGPRWLLVGLAVAMIVAVGASRVVLGVHYSADVLGSWLLGFAWLSVTSTVYLALVGPRVAE